MLNSENKELRGSQTDQGFDRIRSSDRGVMCVFTHTVSDEKKLVLFTVDKEDFENVTKSERLKHMIEMVLVGASMLAFPGGKVEVNEELESALGREIKEESGIEIDLSRLQVLESDPFEVMQSVTGRQGREGIRTYQVTGFSYELTAAELSQMTAVLAEQARSIVVVTMAEAQVLETHQLRPSSRGLLEVYRRKNGGVSEF